MKLTVKLTLVSLFIILSVRFSFSQEIINEIYEINPISWHNPLMSFTKKQVIKEKYKTIINKNDTIIIKDLSYAYSSEMPYRVKCYQISNDLKIDDPKVIELKKKMKTLLDLWEFYKNLDYKSVKTFKIDESSEAFLFQGERNINVKELTKDYRRDLEQRIDKLTDEIDTNFKCTAGFNSIQGSLSFSNGYLEFEPLKYPILDFESDELKRIKSYLNAEDKNKGRKIGLRLKPNELVRLKHKSDVFGALTMPFKVYLKSKEKDSTRGNNVYTDANISLFIGKQWGYHGYNSKGELQRKKMHSLNFLMGATKITLKKNNSSRVEDSDFNILGLSTGLAYSFSLNKFNLFSGLGVDIPLSSEGSKWYFNKQPWLGFGIGYSVFN